ncbi:hypothetical protein [Acaryochloris sp. IP29b_bin.148]|uniref:hypothetical protein n=1 Tax=Acaryochloris sp. IP29b_bin.148 TaxID=2969218 RepID=UPI002634D7CF|nr:hypothetical protein [Acaryochloris sp. IP29b_bin.148]
MHNFNKDNDMNLAEEIESCDSIIAANEVRALAGDTEALEIVQIATECKREAIEHWEKTRADLTKRRNKMLKNPELIPAMQREACKDAIELCEKLKAQHKTTEGGENFGI